MQSGFGSILNDYKPHNNLSVDYRLLGQYEKSAQEALETIRLLPDQVFGYVNLAIAYNALNRLDKAKRAYDDAKASTLDFEYLRAARYLTAFLQGDEAVMRQEVDWAMGRPRAENLLLATHSDTKAYYGESQKARELSERAVQSAKQAAHSGGRGLVESERGAAGGRDWQLGPSTTIGSGGFGAQCWKRHSGASGAGICPLRRCGAGAGTG